MNPRERLEAYKKRMVNDAKKMRRTFENEFRTSNLARDQINYTDPRTEALWAGFRRGWYCRGARKDMQE